MKKYKINDNSILMIEENAFNKLLSYSQRPDMNESGGILIGKVIEDYSKMIITDISVPSKLDKSGRFYFTRNKKIAQEFLDLKWKESNQVINYIGEWHTHSELYPQPSSVDLKMINQCLKENYFPFGGLFLIIVGCSGELYVGYKVDLRIELQILREI